MIWRTFFGLVKIDVAPVRWYEVQHAFACLGNYDSWSSATLIRTQVPELSSFTQTFAKLPLSDETILFFFHQAHNVRRP